MAQLHPLSKIAWKIIIFPFSPAIKYNIFVLFPSHKGSSDCLTLFGPANITNIIVSIWKWLVVMSLACSFSNVWIFYNFDIFTICQGSPGRAVPLLSGTYLCQLVAMKMLQFTVCPKKNWQLLVGFIITTVSFFWDILYMKCSCVC